MTFSIKINFPEWVKHQSSVLQKFGGVEKFIPVIKSNGYGLGQANLARTATMHAVERIAVGTIFEVESVASDFAGEIVVLEPVNPQDPSGWNLWEQYRHSSTTPKLIQTVDSLDSLKVLSEIQSRFPVLLEVRTSMNRFGFHPSELQNGFDLAKQSLNLFGFTAHFPPNTPLSVATEALSVIPVEARDLEISISHLSATDFTKLNADFQNLKIRVGTEFWLGNRSLIQAAGQVLAIHDTVGTVSVGYNQLRTSKSFAIVSGGTAHGVSLSAPRAGATMRQRLAALAEGILQAAGRSRSPFYLNGKKLWFIEPPHQQVSIVQLPSGHNLSVGMELVADVRFTITHADEIQGFTS